MSTQLNYINYPNSAEAVLLDPHPSVGYFAFENFQHTPTRTVYKLQRKGDGGRVGMEHHHKVRHQRVVLGLLVDLTLVAGGAQWVPRRICAHTIGGAQLPQ